LAINKVQDDAMSRTKDRIGHYVRWVAWVVGPCHCIYHYQNQNHGQTGANDETVQVNT